MTPLSTRLLPDNSTFDSAGALSVGGAPLVELARDFGTPLFVYDEAHLRARAAEAVAALGPDGAIYATKAFLCRAMANLVHEEGMRLDVATGGELAVALAADVPAERLVLHGNNKAVWELRAAIDAGVGRIVVDSTDEMHRIEALVAQGSAVPKVVLRINPGIEVHTHEHVRTGNLDSKFGFPISTGQAHEAVRWAASSSAMELVGLHLHIGSQVFSVDNFLEGLRVVAPFVVQEGLPELIVGGGLGVAYVEEERAPTITSWAGAIVRTCREEGISARDRGGAG